MRVLRSACEASAVIGLSSGSIIPTLKNGFTVMHEQAGSGSGAQVMNMLLPSGPALESYFEQQGLGRAQEGKRLKMLTSLILEVGRKSGLVVLLSFFFTQSLVAQKIRNQRRDGRVFAHHQHLRVSCGIQRGKIRLTEQLLIII